MSTNEFDRLIQDKFDNNEFEYKPGSWQQLSHRLDITPPPAKTIATGTTAGIARWLPKAGMAAGVALVIGLSVFFLNKKPTADTPATADVAPKQSQQAVTPPVAPEVKNTAIQTSQPANTAATTFVATQAKRNAVNKPVQQQQAPQQPANTVVPQANTNNEHIAQTNTPQPQHTEEKKPLVKQPKQPDFADNAYTPEDKYRKPGGKTSFSLAGGVNYGSLNTGYTVGVSARRKLGDGRFYLEGDVAFVNSNAPKAAAVSDAQYDALNSNYSGGTKNTGGTSGEPTALAFVSAPVKTVSQEQALNNLYYLQFSPSVGYNIKKNISVSVGADVQRLLPNSNNDETPVVLESDELKLIPQTDVGLTGKAEYGVTRRLKAGMMYREGVNALIDNKYINRRYLQVQLKFMLFGK